MATPATNLTLSNIEVDKEMTVVNRCSYQTASAADTDLLGWKHPTAPTSEVGISWMKFTSASLVLY